MTAGTMTTVPNQPKTPNRTMRIPDVEWEAWREAADEDGVSITDYVRKTMNGSVKRRARKPKSPAD